MQPHEVAIPIMFFIVLGTIWVVWLFARHRERMTMVEKGMSSEDMKALYAKQIHHDPLSSLKWGLLFVLAGVAIMLGNFLHYHYGVDEGAIVGMVILFVGIGLVAFYSIAAKKMNQ